MPVSGSTGYRSGFLGLPPRVQLRIKDDAMGTYPTIARTGDQEYTGKFPVQFDDTTTLIYSGSSTLDTNQPLVYPTLLPRGYVFATSSVENSLGFSLGVATPNITSSLSFPISPRRNLVSSIADTMFQFSTNNEASQSLRPFNDSRIYLSTSSFYLTGTDPSVLPGFSQQLGDKVQIVIDLNPVEETSIFFSTGTLPSATTGYTGGVNSGIAYFNWRQKRWEVIGDLSTGSNVDYINARNLVRTGSYWAFPNGQVATSFANPNFKRTATASGMPSNIAGFPLATKFDATGSQLKGMSDYINHPFLLEKIVFEWTGSLNIYPVSQEGSPAAKNNFPQVANFFILNQFQTPVTRSVNSGKQIYANSTTVQYHDLTNGPFNVFREKDLVTFGSIVRSRDRTDSQLEDWEKRDLILVGGNGVLGSGGITGSFRLKTSASMGGIWPNGLGPIIANRTLQNQTIYPGNPLGGRNLFGETSGRSFIASAVGAQITGSRFNPYTAANQQYIQPYKNLHRTSPYVILPTDQLVFGFANQPSPYAGSAVTTDASEHNVGNVQRAVMAPGPSKVTLFGSLVRNNLPTQVSDNAPLTSDAIHEALHSDNPVVDQFQVDPFYSYWGSYIDTIVKGDMFAGTREVVGSPTAGTQGITGSLLRGVRLENREERYYDSLMPTLSSYFSKWVGSGSIFPPSKYGLSVPAYYFSGAMSVPDSGDETLWIGDRALPVGAYIGDPQRVVKDNAVLVVSGSTNDKFFKAIKNYADLREAVFKIGVQNKSYSVTKNGGSSTSTQVLIDKKFTGARGFRYGIVNTEPYFTNGVFRYDRFGQFRDMLEQRLDTRFYDASNSSTYILDSVVNIQFVFQDSEGNVDLVSPSSTISQNLSHFATSSLPFFDGIAVDRNDDPNKNVNVVITTLG